jgi:alanine racemase
MAGCQANAYNHGAAPLAHEAVRNGADVLGVARVHEGVEIRRAGLEAPILVFEVLPDDQIGSALHHHLMLTVAGEGHAARISEMAQRLRLPAVIHAKVDTGMSRLGFPHQTAVKVLADAAKLPGVELGGIYSHFATSDEEDPAFARVQLERFREVAEGLRKAGVHVPVKHMANSGHLSMPVRIWSPGIMLTVRPPGAGHPLQPVSRSSPLRSQDRGRLPAPTTGHLPSDRCTVGGVRRVSMLIQDAP